MKPQYAKIPSQRADSYQYVQFHKMSGCSYEWYSDVFECSDTFDLQTITIFGIEDGQMIFTKDIDVICSGVEIFTHANIVFIFDISEAVTEAQFQDSAAFALNSLSQFSIGFASSVQVAVFSVYGDKKGDASQVSNLSTPDYDSLKSIINNIYSPDASNSGTGQKGLFQALNRTMNQYFKLSGYHDNIYNHLIVYITTNSVPDQDAIGIASDILSSGNYSIVAISYQGNGSNINALQQLVGDNPGCVLTSSTKENYLGDFADSFGEKIY
ncbi:hypothetical protein FO519_009949, partial [Halicephalobus sp. NKZ332]